jgi:hypothetical protein
MTTFAGKKLFGIFANEKRKKEIFFLMIFIFIFSPFWRTNLNAN